jgi:hypothetical protein
VTHPLIAAILAAAQAASKNEFHHPFAAGKWILAPFSYLFSFDLVFLRHVILRR